MPRLPFDTIQALDLPLTELVGGRINFAHDIFLSFRYEVLETLPTGAEDLVILVGKSDRGTSLRQIAEYPGRVILVFVPGDASVRNAYIPGRATLPPNVVAAFATNNEMADRRIVSTPLGVRVNKLRWLQFVRQNYSGPRDKLLYANFAFNVDHYPPDRRGTPHIRARLVEQLGEMPWVTWDVSSDHRDSYAELIRYYTGIAGHRFVLSPPGHGVDCYRTWEALYLGAIPVVMMSPQVSAFSELPILFTEDFSDISEDSLEKKWSEMTSRSFEIDRMLRSWYLHRFLEAVSTLKHPRFVCWQIGDSPPDKFIDALARSSRSPSALVAESPTPPFTGSLRLMDPESWNVVGGLELSKVDEGMRVSASEDGKRLLEIPLETINGAPFALRGEARPGADALALNIELSDRSGCLEAVDVETQTSLHLRFVARRDRTVLRITAADDASGAMILSGLELHAEI